MIPKAARQLALIGFASLLLPMPLKVFSAGLQGFQMQHTGLSLRCALRDAAPFATLALGAGLTTGGYAACAWRLVLGADERARTLAWARRQLRLRPSRPG